MILYLFIFSLIFVVNADIPVDRNGWELIDKNFPNDTKKHQNYFYVRSSEKDKIFQWKIEKPLKEEFKDEQIASDRITLSFEYWISDPNAVTKLLIGSEKFQFGRDNGQKVYHWYSYSKLIDPKDGVTIEVKFDESNEIVAFANVMLSFYAFDSKRSVQLNRLKRADLQVEYCDMPVPGNDNYLDAFSYCMDLPNSDETCESHNGTFRCGCNTGYEWESLKCIKSQNTSPEATNGENWIRFYNPPTDTQKFLYFSNNCLKNACTMTVPKASVEKEIIITIKAWTFRMTKEPKIELKLDSSTNIKLTGLKKQTEDKSFETFKMQEKSKQMKETKLELKIETFEGTFIAIQSIKIESAGKTYCVGGDLQCNSTIEIDSNRLHWMTNPDSLNPGRLYYYPSKDHSALEIQFSNSDPTDYQFEIDYRGPSTNVLVLYESDQLLQLKIMKNRIFSFRLSNLRTAIEPKFRLSLNTNEQFNKDNDVRCFISVGKKELGPIPSETSLLFLTHWQDKGSTKGIDQWNEIVPSKEATFNSSGNIPKKVKNFKGTSTDWNSVIYGSVWFKYNDTLKSIDSIVNYTVLSDATNSIVTVRACDSFGFCYPMEISEKSPKFKIPSKMETSSIRIEIQIDYIKTSIINIGPEISIGDFCHYDKNESRCNGQGTCTTISPSKGMCECNTSADKNPLYTADSYCKTKLWCADEGKEHCVIAKEPNVAPGTGKKCLELSFKKSDKSDLDFQCICNDKYFWDGKRCAEIPPLQGQQKWRKFVEPPPVATEDTQTDFLYYECSSLDCSIELRSNTLDANITLSFEFWGKKMSEQTSDNSITVRYLKNGKPEPHQFVDGQWSSVFIPEIDKTANIVIEMPKLSIVAIRLLKLKWGTADVTCNQTNCLYWKFNLKGIWGKLKKLNGEYFYPTKSSDPFLVNVPRLDENVQMCVNLEYWYAATNDSTTSVHVQTQDQFNPNGVLKFTPITDGGEFMFCSKQLQAPHVEPHVKQFSVFVQNLKSYSFSSFVMRVKETHIVEYPKPPEFAFFSSWEYTDDAKYNAPEFNQYNYNYKEMLQKQWPSVRVIEWPYAKYYQYPYHKWSDDAASTDGHYALTFKGKSLESGFVQSQWIDFKKQQNRQLTVKKAKDKDVVHATIKFCSELMRCESRQITIGQPTKTLPSIDTAKLFTIIVEVHVLKTETTDDETTVTIEAFSFGDKCSEPKKLCGSNDTDQKCLSNSIGVKQFQCACSSKFFGEGKDHCKKDECSKETDFSKDPYKKLNIHKNEIQNGNDFCKNQLEPTKCIVSGNTFKCDCRTPEFTWNDKDKRCERNSPKHKQFVCDDLNCHFKHMFGYIPMALPDPNHFDRPYLVPLKIGDTLNFKLQPLDAENDACVNFNYLLKEGAGQLQFQSNGKTNGIQFLPSFDTSNGNSDWGTDTETLCVRDSFSDVSKAFTMGFVATKSISGVAVKIPPADGTPALDWQKGQFPREFPFITKWKLANETVENPKGLDSFERLWTIRIPRKSFTHNDTANTVQVKGFTSGISAQMLSAFITKQHERVTFRVNKTDHDVTLFVLQCNANAECFDLPKSFHLRTINESVPHSVDLKWPPTVPYKIGFRFNFTKTKTNDAVSVIFGPILMGDACFDEKTFKVRECNNGTCQRNNDGTFKCKCPEGVLGDDCSRISYCKYKDPNNGHKTGDEVCSGSGSGECSEGSVDQSLNFTCTCAEKTVWDWTHKRCKDIGDCADVLCEANHQCINGKCYCDKIAHDNDGKRIEKCEDVCGQATFMPITLDCVCPPGKKKTNDNKCIPQLCQLTGDNPCQQKCKPIDEQPYYKCSCGEEYNPQPDEKTCLPKKEFKKCKCPADAFCTNDDDENACQCNSDKFNFEAGKCVPKDVHPTVYSNVCPEDKAKIVDNKVVCECLEPFTRKNGSLYCQYRDVCAENQCHTKRQLCIDGECKCPATRKMNHEYKCVPKCTDEIKKKCASELFKVCDPMFRVESEACVCRVGYTKEDGTKRCVQHPFQSNIDDIEVRITDQHVTRRKRQTTMNTYDPIGQIAVKQQTLKYNREISAEFGDNSEELKLWTEIKENFTKSFQYVYGYGNKPEIAVKELKRKDDKYLTVSMVILQSQKPSNYKESANGFGSKCKMTNTGDCALKIGPGDDEWFRIKQSSVKTIEQQIQKLLNPCLSSADNVCSTRTSTCYNEGKDSLYSCTCNKDWFTHVDQDIIGPDNHVIQTCQLRDFCKEHECPRDSEPCVPIAPHYENGKITNTDIELKRICDCKSGYANVKANGTHEQCTNVHDLCKSAGCSNGECEQKGRNGWACRCHEGFSGDTCKTEFKQSNVGFIVTVAVLSVVIVIALIAAFVFARRAHSSQSVSRGYPMDEFGGSTYRVGQQNQGFQRN